MNDTPPNTRTSQGKRRGHSKTSPSSHSRRPGQKGRHQDAAARRTATIDNRTEAETHIFGIHAANFALANSDRAVTRIRTTENAERRLNDAMSGRKLAVERVTPRSLDKILGADTVHQGVLLDVAPLEPWPVDQLISQAVATGHPMLILDQVTDPHNVGAVLRSAAVFGGAGIIMTRRHSPPLGGVLAKAASGALDLVPVSLVQNLSETIADIQKRGLKVVGMDGGLEHPLLEDGLKTIAQDGPIVLALGAEGKGLRERTLNACDLLCRIGGDGPIDSLNVSNAAAVALHMCRLVRQS